MSTPQAGDRVRFTYEGEVVDVERDGDILLAGHRVYQSVGRGSQGTVGTVEVIEKKPPKVGDAVRPGYYEDAPVGVVVRTGAGSHFFRTRTGWTDLAGLEISTSLMEHTDAGGRTVVYLPEQ